MTNGADSRTRILDTARTHFLEKAYHGSTLRDIAQDAGVTTGSLYHHFAGKDELFVEVCMEGLRNLTQRVATAASSTEKAPLPERVLALFNAYASFYAEERGYYELLETLHVFSDRLNLKERLAGRVKAAAKSLLDQMVVLLQQEEPNWDRAELERRAMFAVSMAEGLISCDRKGFLSAFGLGLASFQASMVSMAERVVLAE